MERPWFIKINWTLHFIPVITEWFAIMLFIELNFEFCFYYLSLAILLLLKLDWSLFAPLQALIIQLSRSEM